MKIKKTLPILALSLALVACGGDKSNTENSTKENTTNPVSTSETMDKDDSKEENQAPASTSEMDTKYEEKLSVKEIVQNAKKDYPDYQLEEVSFDADEENLYEVTLFKDNMEVSLDLDIFTGEVKQKEEDDEDDNMVVLDEKYLDNLDKYLEDILADADGDGEEHYFKEWDLKTEDGSPILKAEVALRAGRKDAYSYKVDPSDGKIIEKEIED
jgi:uncharacterized membrane protein YkoI